LGACANDFRVGGDVIGAASQRHPLASGSYGWRNVRENITSIANHPIMILSLVLGMLFGVLVSFGYRLSPLLISSRRVTLVFPPASLRIGEVVLAIMSMILKSVFYAIPGIPRRKHPGLELDSPFILNAEDIALYQLAVGGESGTEEELSLPHLMLLLAAMTEPAMLLLLASPWCPINPLGAVNVRNKFILLRHDLCKLSILVSSQSARLKAIIHNHPRQAKRGIEWDLEVMINIPTGRNDGSVDIIFRQIFTMLELGKSQSKKTGSDSNKTTSSLETPHPAESTTQMLFSADDPLKWAALCKDYNFIHLSGAAAKAFGLPGKIAHGNHAFAKALQQITDSKSSQLPFDTTSYMELQFIRPMVVPGVFDISAHEDSETCKKISISARGKTYATAQYGSLQE
jgi:acyl dehydratase